MLEERFPNLAAWRDRLKRGAGLGRSVRRPAGRAHRAELVMADERAMRFLDWPFFEARHRALARELDAWATTALGHAHGHGADVDAACRALVRSLGAAGWLRARGRRPRARRRGRRDRHARDLPDPRDAGAPRRPGRLRVRDAGPRLGRDQPRRHAEQKARYLPRVARGEAIAAFALSEPDAGSDVAAMQCAARVDGDALRARRREDLDLQRRHRRLLRRVRAAPARRRARAASRPSSSMPARRASRSPSAST